MAPPAKMQFSELEGGHGAKPVPKELFFLWLSWLFRLWPVPSLRDGIVDPVAVQWRFVQRSDTTG